MWYKNPIRIFIINRGWKEEPVDEYMPGYDLSVHKKFPETNEVHKLSLIKWVYLRNIILH